MSNRFMFLMLMAGFCLVFAFVGCSDDPASSGGGTVADTTALEIFDLSEVVSRVAPPPYSAPLAKAYLDSFEIWTEGDYPLLEKVFGNDDPQTLYRNIESFEDYVQMAEEFLLVDQDGNLLTGTFADSVTDSLDGQAITFYASVTVTELTSPVAIPAAAQGIIGTSVDLDYLATTEVDMIPNGTNIIGLKMDSTQQTILIYEADMSGEEGADESSLVYASLNLSDSTFVFKGVGYSSDAQGIYNYVFNMTSQPDGDFTYRMSSYSDDVSTEQDILNCIIGGGNKDVEFALTYRSFVPANAASPDPTWSFEEVFGPNYTNGTGLLTDYSSYIDTSLYYDYEDVPQGDVVNPYLE